MKRAIQITASILLVLLLAGAGTLFYINKAVVPVTIKKVFAEKTKEMLGRNLSISSAKFSILKGFILKDIVIFEQDSKTPFIHIDSIRFNILYFPIFKEKKVIIPSITIEKPIVTITRRLDNTWNFDDAIIKLTAPRNEKNPFAVFIGNILVNRGKIHFADQLSNPGISQTIEDISLKAGLSLPKSAKFSADAKIADSPKPSAIHTEGNYDFVSKTLIARINLGEAVLTKYAQAYYQSPDIYIENVALKSADIVLTVTGDKIEAQNNIDFNRLDIRVGPDKKISGNPLLDVAVRYDPSAQTKLSYEGFVDARSVAVTGIPYAGQVKDVAGKIYFKPDEIKSESLTLTVGTAKIQASGMITDFKNPAADIRAASRIDLATLQTLFPSLFENTKIKQLSGQASVAVDYKGPLVPFQIAQLNASADISNAALTTEQIPAPLTKISGKIQHASDSITFRDFVFSLSDTAIQLSGTLTGLNQPVADIRASSDVDLQAISLIFPDIFNKAPIENLSGRSKVDLQYKGPLATPQQAKFALTALLNSVNLDLKNPAAKLSGISGKVEYTPNNVSWEKLELNFNNTVYTTNGTLANFSSPIVMTTIEAVVMSPDANLKTKLNISQNYKKFEVAYLKGRYLGSDFDLSGDVDLPENSDPLFSLAGKLSFDLKNLGLIPAIPAETIKNLKPAGIITAEGSVKSIGSLKDWPKWQILLNATSPEIILNGYRLKENSLNYTQDLEQGGWLEMASLFYNGPLKITARTTPSQNSIPYTLTANLEKTDLSQLKADTVFKDKDISGYLAATLSARGLLDNIRGIEGEGAILIKEGRLWQLDLFKGLAKFLVIPEFDSIIVKSAAGDFTIADERVSTSNFELGSDSVILMCAGYVDFDTNLNFDIAAQFSEETIAQSPSLKKTVTAFLTQTGDYITVKLTGTLSNPKYSVVPLSVNLFKKATGILQGIFSK
ncbi:MAG TPA: hypothetical protein PL155_02160 [Candidatus Omnitrophota bacterium]|nr:hypothetical protein [Candidatus Omnitrophota bacterium]HPD84711.1 hypothetical protein [Candidatus Omnitrophota bacterium]HRZ03569.1 hypothetical protein [Candidatus Omnitrophota bacterium]